MLVLVPTAIATEKALVVTQTWACATLSPEQSATTQEIAQSVAQASEGVQEVNQNVAQSSAVTNSIAADIADVNQSSTAISTSSGQVKHNAEDMSSLAQTLTDLVNRFKI